MIFKLNDLRLSDVEVQFSIVGEAMGAMIVEVHNIVMGKKSNEDGVEIKHLLSQKQLEEIAEKCADWYSERLTRQKNMN